MPIVDINGTLVDFPDDMNPDQLKSAVSSAAKKISNQGSKSFLGINKENLPQSISTFARPILEGTGAVVGGGLGLASPVPGGTAIGGALGLGGGIAASNLLDRYLGVKKPIKNLPEAAKETMTNVRQGAEGEMVGQIGGKILSSMKKPLTKAAGNIGRIMSGVKEQHGQRLFQDPNALFTPSVEKAGEKLGKVRNALGMNVERPAEEVFQSEAAFSRKKALEMFEKMAEKTATPTELLQGIQATDKVIEATPMRQRSQRADLFDIKNKFAEALNMVAGPERAAAKEYARSALGSQFRKFFPVTKQGDVSVFRTLGLGALEGQGAKALSVIPSLVQSPILSGLGISSAGQLYKALSHPEVRRAIVAALDSTRQ